MPVRLGIRLQGYTLRYLIAQHGLPKRRARRRGQPQLGYLPCIVCHLVTFASWIKYTPESADFGWPEASSIREIEHLLISELQ